MLLITPVERSALQLLARGKATAEIAGHLGTSERELEARLTSLFGRMGVASRTEAVTVALRRGLLIPDERADAGLKVLTAQ
jgi:DNA-binding NarL/FixJ family response regulator